MNGKSVAESVNADLNTLEKELRELHKQARMAAAQENDPSRTDEGSMVVRGR